MNEVIKKDNIENMIYEIRGKQVMLDSDLAILYQCKNGTKAINQAVKRHINKFPERFMFQLTDSELFLCSRSQSVTLNKRGLNIKYNPYVFTEQGVAMLATILRTDIADEISIKIMDAFVLMRHYLSDNLIEQKYINKLVLNDNQRINVLEESFSKLEENEKINHIFFEGQIYDAYSLLVDILSSSESEIIIIDNYAGKELLDIIKNINKKIIIYSKNIDETLIQKYKQEYSNVTLIYNDSFHDRFIILDKKIMYNCGASFKELGKKCFAINKIEDEFFLKEIIKRLY
jgi:hypothetical protein